jgi:lambda family phage tail tape measure protein
MATIDNYKINIDVTGESKVENLKGRIAGLGTAIAGLGLAAFTQQVMAMVAEINDLSNATGITSEKILNLRKSISFAGGSIEDTGKLITVFYQNLEKAASGSEEAQAALEKVGIQFKDLSTLSETQLLDKAIEGLSNMEAGAERTAIGMDILGKAFRNIDPAELKRRLDAGDLEGLRDEFDEIDKLSDMLEYSFNNLKIAFAKVFGDMLKALEPFIGKMEETGLSVEQAEKLVRALGIALGVVFGVKMLTMIATVATEIYAVAKALGAAELAAGGFGGKLRGALGLLAKVGVGVGLATATTNLNQGEDAELARRRASDPTYQRLQAELAKKQQAEAAANKPTPTPQKPAFANAQLLSDEEVKAMREKLIATQGTTEQLKLQYETQQKLLQVSNEMIGKDALQASYIRNITAAEQERLSRLSEIEKQIREEREKGRTTNQAVIQELNKQKEIVEQNFRATIKLREEERQRLEQQRNLTLEMAAKVQNITMGQDLAHLKERNSLIGLTNYNLQEQTIKLRNIQEMEKRVGALQNEMYNKAAATEMSDFEIKMYERRIADLQSYYMEKNRIELQGLEMQKAIQRDFTAGWRTAHEQYLLESTSAFRIAGQQFNAITSNMNSALDNFVETGKLSFSDLAESIIKDILKIELRAAAANLFGMISGTTGGAGGGSNIIGSLLGFANGGQPPVNKPSIVGERGPELFVPKTAGTVIPNNQMGGVTNNTYITNNISAVDAKSVAQLFAENRRTLLGTVRAAEKELPYRV